MSLTPVRARYIKHPSEDMFRLVDSLTRVPDSAYVEIGPEARDVLTGDSVIYVEANVIREMATAWMREHRIG